METLIRELNALQEAPVVTSQQLVGAVVATATRVDQALDERMIGMQALAMALAMQPAVDALRLREDFLAILERQFDCPSQIPADLRDMASALAVAAADRR